MGNRTSAEVRQFARHKHSRSQPSQSSSKRICSSLSSPSPFCRHHTFAIGSTLAREKVSPSSTATSNVRVVFRVVNDTLFPFRLVVRYTRYSRTRERVVKMIEECTAIPTLPYEFPLFVNTIDSVEMVQGWQRCVLAGPFFGTEMDDFVRLFLRPLPEFASCVDEVYCSPAQAIEETLSSINVLETGNGQSILMCQGLKGHRRMAVHSFKHDGEDLL
eukprot:TRINITY_DN82432_c0_g1_i1.p1 TRINITY_DN82432_c0_g1~~TRINITY_DN82432_c0_g1_i1.p1  ORF type:complete len:217 (-),score=43.00 TRINITY_DN82432_c0_g1_i1:53-703(-)